VILISHDPHLIELAADRLWIVADGTCQPFDGDLADYKRLLLEQARDARRENRAAASKGTPANRRDERRAAADLRAQLAPLRNAVRDAEKRLDALHRRQQAVKAKLADPGLYDGPANTVAAVRKEAGEVDKAVAEAEEAWLAAHAALESAEAAA